MSVDIANTNNKGSSDWYLAQLSKLSIDKKEIPNLIKQQLKVIKELYEIKPQYGKYYIFTNIPDVKVDDLREQILRLIEVSPEAKEVLEASNNYIFIKNDKNIISNLPLLSDHNLITREKILQKIEKVLSEKQFISISAFAGTGKSTISIEYGRKQRDEAKKIVRFIYADSADKIFEAYRQLAKEFAIYTIGEKEEDIIRLVHERIANLKPSTLFIFDNVEAYKDIEPYINGIINMPRDKTQVIITTRHNNLSDNIENIKLLPFSKNEAISYLVESLGDRLNEQDISNLLAELSSEDGFILPYSLSEAVACLKENKLLKVNDYINYLQDSEDDHPGTVLLLQSLEKSPAAWQILQCSAHLDPDFISIDIFKELFLVNEEKLQEPIKRLEALSLMNLIRQNGQTGLQLHRLVQVTVKRYVKRHTEFVIYEQKVRTALIEVLDNLFPYLTGVPNKDWEISKLFYPHIVKILNNNIEIDKLRKANLYRKLAYYNDYILYKFEKSLKYHKEVLKILQKLYKYNHPNIAHSLNDVGAAYEKLGYTREELKYFKEALKMSQGLYQGNHPDIAASLNNVRLAYRNLGDISKGLKYFKEALKMNQELYKGNHSSIASSLNNIGEIYINLNDIFKALKYFKEALKMFQELPYSNPFSIANSLNNIGRQHF
ncbi:tetratricopeptide repeat protein [Rickettsia hoogstraalii]